MFAMNAPFIDALIAGDFNAASRLLKQGVDVNSIVGESQWSALHYAAEQQNVAVVQWLLDNGANADANDFAGQTPTFVAIDSANDSAHDIYVRTGARSFGNEVLRLLLTRGANPNATRNDGLTLLQLARKKRNSEAEELLTSFGALDSSR